MLSDNQQRSTPINSLVFTSVKKFALAGLSDLIRVLMENIDDALFDLSEKAESDRERNMYFEAMREIRIKRNMLQIGFDQAMEASFESLILNKPIDSAELDPDELSLVALEDIEDSIAVDNMISKARPTFEDDLFAVGERLKVILNRDSINENLNPLDPKAICNSFHKASDVLETDIQIKLIFYKLFDKYVMANLGRFYAQMNEFFVEKNVLPDFKASAERLKQTAKFMSNRTRSSVDQSQSKDQSESPGSIEATSPNQSENVPTANGDGGLLAMLQQALAGAGGGQSGSAFMPTQNSSAFAGSPTQNSGSTATGGQGSTSSITEMAPAGAYLSALTDLQVASIQSQPALTTDPGEFKQQMQQQLVTFTQQNQHQTSAADNQIIDIVSMLFDFFLDDDTLPDPVKVLIGRLQIPILKAAIIDNNFFNQKKHTARQLLDSISKASLGWTADNDRSKALIDEIDSVVEFILAEFEQDLTIFDTALQRFTDYLTTEKEKTQKADEAIIQQEQDKDRQIDEAQAAANALIHRISKNQSLSFEVSDFLETIWTSVLFHCYLSLGDESNHWHNLGNISSTLVWTLIPKHSEDERLKILKTLPFLLRALSKGMELVKIGSEAQNRIYKMLAQEHAKVVKQTTKNIVTRKANEDTIWPEDEAIADAFSALEDKSIDAAELNEAAVNDGVDSINNSSIAPTDEVIGDLENFTASVKNGEIEVSEEITLGSLGEASFQSAPKVETDDFLQQAQALEIGSWIEFHDVGETAVNTRLSWKSNVTGKLVFVNRQGSKVKDMSVNNFAIELRSGRAKMVESSSVFDRAIHNIMSKIKH